MIDSVEQKIIQAAIECIEKYGLTGVTNRRIAQVAGVNSAAINYYFRSQENLIKKVMELTVNTVFNWERIEALPGATAKARCTAIFENLLKGGYDYPGIMRAHFYELVTEGSYDSLVAQRYSDFMAKLCEDLWQRGVELSRLELQLACTQIASACFMVILAPKLNAQSFEIDLRDEQTRHRFVSRLVEKLL